MTNFSVMFKNPVIWCKIYAKVTLLSYTSQWFTQYEYNAYKLTHFVYKKQIAIFSVYTSTLLLHDRETQISIKIPFYVYFINSLELS